MLRKKVKIYIAYKQNDTRRRNRLEEIKNTLENDFNYSAWYDKSIRGGRSLTSECSKMLDWANNFLLVAHRETHKSPFVKEEIRTALTNLISKKYKNVVVLLMHPKVNIKKYESFLRNKKYIKKYTSIWKEELQQSFLPKHMINASQNKLYDDLYKAIASKGSRKERVAKELVQKVLNSRKKPDNLIEALRLLNTNTNNKKHKSKIQEMVGILKKEDILKKHSKKLQPKRNIVNVHNRMLKNIQSNHSKVYHDACKLYEGLVYLLKPFNTKDTSVLGKIRSLGITEQIESVIKNELIRSNIAVQVGDTLWIQDDNLGRKIMNEVFFSKNPMVNFDNIERLFYGKN